MDGYRTDGSIYEKKILSYQEVIALQIDMIIIVARPNITELIRNRIAAFCKKNSIVLFSADGKKLNIKMNKLDNEYFPLVENYYKIKSTLMISYHLMF